ncbi:MAG: hypothetical protein EOO04_14815 [Chitinophagaceae bacterium]|nr:MAG: hypothetical protein EOO04_14815 [Chitinophagaceae bacterium]
MRVIPTGNVLGYCCILLFTAFPFLGTAQHHRLEIYLADGDANVIAHANISVNAVKTSVDSLGHKTLYLIPGRYNISVSAVGHYPLNTSIALHTDTTINLLLIRRETMLGNVTVTGGRQMYKTQMSAQSLTIAQLRKLPVILGEIDPMKTITLLPGIKSGGEASAGVYVRGGGPDQNLVLLDGINVYNPNHLLGFFSVFNGEAIKGVEVIKGGIPAEYGGRLSSVIAIDTRSGHKDSTKVSGGIGAIASKIAIEGPIIKGKLTYMFSGRRTYLDQVAKIAARETIGNNGYYFYDFNGKIDYTINQNNTLSATMYGGKDKFTYADVAPEGDRIFGANWGNRIAGLTWKQQISPALKQQTSVIYNDFRLDSRFGYGTSNYVFSSGLRDYQLKHDLQYNARPWLKIKSGIQYITHRFKPGAGEVMVGEQDFIPQITAQYAREAAAYISAETQITDALHVVTGLRYSYFNQVGPTEQVLYEKDGTPTGETQVYGKGESIARYHYPEPRLNLLYKLSGKSSLKASYTRTVQYLHLATTSAATFPSDLWIPASRAVKPGQAWQAAAGYYRNILNNHVELSAEIYYKEMSNQIEFRPGAQLLLNQNLEGEMIFGSGKAYGLEILAQKKHGRLNGWIGYTLSRAERTFPDLNEGKAFAYRYDRTHDVSVVANFRINKHWDASGVFVYGTGNALTLPTGRYTYNTGFNRVDQHFIFTTIDQYSKINAFRMPSYHRLDLSFIYTRKPDKHHGLRSSWNFSVYNVYNRYNPYFIYLDVRRMEQQINAKMVYLFPVLPSVTWNFKLD